MGNAALIALFSRVQDEDDGMLAAVLRLSKELDKLKRFGGLRYDAVEDYQLAIDVEEDADRDSVVQKYRGLQHHVDQLRDDLVLVYPRAQERGGDIYDTWEALWGGLAGLSGEVLLQGLHLHYSISAATRSAYDAVLLRVNMMIDGDDSKAPSMPIAHVDARFDEMIGRLEEVRDLIACVPDATAQFMQRSEVSSSPLSWHSLMPPRYSHN